MAEKRTTVRYCTPSRAHCAATPDRLIATLGPFGSSQEYLDRCARPDAHRMARLMRNDLCAPLSSVGGCGPPKQPYVRHTKAPATCLHAL